MRRREERCEAWEDVQEKWITVEMGGVSRRCMPESKYPEAEKESKRLIDLAVKTGTPLERAKEMFGIKIVEEE